MTLGTAAESIGSWTVSEASPRTHDVFLLIKTEWEQLFIKILSWPRSAIWNTSGGDTVILCDSSGEAVATYSYQS